MLGLENAGKSHLLATLCGETTQDLPPTNGFSIKDVCLQTCILHVKEVGGSDKIRPYWEHYMDRTEGVVFVMNGSELGTEKLSQVKDVLAEVMNNELLIHKPLLLLVTRIDPDSSEVIDLAYSLELPRLNCSFIVDYTHDTAKVRETLQNFADNICLQRYADSLPVEPTRI